MAIVDMHIEFNYASFTCILKINQLINYLDSQHLSKIVA